MPSVTDGILRFQKSQRAPTSPPPCSTVRRPFAGAAVCRAFRQRAPQAVMTASVKGHTPCRMPFLQADRLLVADVGSIGRALTRNCLGVRMEKPALQRKADPYHPAFHPGKAAVLFVGRGSAPKPDDF